MLLARDATRNKYPQMANALMDRVDNCLCAGQDLFVACVEIDDPSERLLGWCNVVAF